MAPYGMIAPLLTFILVLAIYPTVLTTISAFFKNDALDPTNHQFGFGNFIQVFSNPDVRASLVNTAWYVVFGVGLTVFLGTAIGLLLQRNFVGRGVVLAILILPWALPGVVEGIIWTWIYDANFGVLNRLAVDLGLISHYQVWIGAKHLQTLFLISLVQVWQLTPLAAILVLASLQGIPAELYEAARVDGANWWRSIRSVSLPLIRPGLAVATVNALIISLNIFDQVYVLNQGATFANSLMGSAYQLVFDDYNLGQGYALSLVGLIATVLLAAGAMKLIYRKVAY